MPDALAVLIHFPNAVKGHAMNPPIPIRQSEHSWVILGKIHFRKPNQDDPFLNAVKIAEVEVPARKLFVPANAVQQFVNGHGVHNHHCLPRNHSSSQASFALPAKDLKVADQPLKLRCVLFAVLSPKNGNSTLAKTFSAESFAIA